MTKTVNIYMYTLIKYTIVMTNLEILSTRNYIISTVKKSAVQSDGVRNHQNHNHVLFRHRKNPFRNLQSKKTFLKPSMFVIFKIKPSSKTFKVKNHAGNFPCSTYSQSNQTMFEIIQIQVLFESTLSCE